MKLTTSAELQASSRRSASRASAVRRRRRASSLVCAAQANRAYGFELPRLRTRAVIGISLCGAAA